MSKSDLLRVPDVREAYRLIGDCVTLEPILLSGSPGWWKGPADSSVPR